MNAPESQSADRSTSTSSGSRLELKPPAKINLNLLVDHKTDGGYHPLDSMVARISLHDELALERRDDDDIRFTVAGLECGPAKSNLAYAAACVLKRLAASAGLDVPGVDIRLTKHIPPGGGLGGGSSDAASTLMGLNQLWDLRRTPEQLAVLAAELGSDVPLFLAEPALRMTGYGQTVESAVIHPFWAILHTPPVQCPTRDVYRAFDDDPPKMAKQLPQDVFAAPPSQWRDQLVNQLAPAAMRVAPELAERFEQLAAALPAPLCLTGSGSSMFMLADTREEAETALSALPPDLQTDSRLVCSLNSDA